MRVSRQYVGKFCEITWKDPSATRILLRDAPKGRAALATWREYGVVDDVTDGVIRIVHSAGCEPGTQTTDEIQYTAVDESLIELIRVFEPVKEDAGTS